MPLTDYHCHILPEIDDGASSMQESVEMARHLAAAGYQRVYCTPHWIRGCYDTTPAQVEKAVAALQKELATTGIDLELLPGMEYYLDEHFPGQLETPRPLGDTGLLLVEAPSQAHPDLIRENIFQVVRRGLTPLFAHPERCGWLAPEKADNGLWSKAKGLITRNSKLKSQNSSQFSDLQKIGCQFQANLGSFAGFYGTNVRDLALRLDAQGAYGYHGTDGHGSDQLRKILTRAPAVDGAAAD